MTVGFSKRLDPAALSLQFNSLLAYLDGWLDGQPPGPYPYAHWNYSSATRQESHSPVGIRAVAPAP